ncbi:MAG: sigma-70 family RNA polymerase sigma factor [Thermoanaerobaculia bacterium]|nr:sigma-70 family RNA polymerase sigma factor [Thermoanaerobaculia bacterium]
MGAEPEDSPVSSSAAADEGDHDELRRALDSAVRRVCPAWLVSARDDLVQVAMMKVIRLRDRRGEGPGEGKASYLWKVAYSTLVDEIRRRRRRPEEALDEAPWRTDPASGDPGPERRAMAAELGEAIRDCLARMVTPRQLAVTLHLQGYTVPEAAALLGWSAKRADNLVYRGLKNLRDCLAGKGLKP